MPAPAKLLYNKNRQKIQQRLARYPNIGLRGQWFIDQFMQHIHEKKQILPLLLSMLGILVLATGTVRGHNSLMDYFELKGSQQVLQETVDKLHREVDLLELEITKIRESRSYALKVLRDKYHITDDHENIMFFAE